MVLKLGLVNRAECLPPKKELKALNALLSVAYGYSPLKSPSRLCYHCTDRCPALQNLVNMLIREAEPFVRLFP